MSISLHAVLGWIFSALLGGAGIVGLLMIIPRHKIERKMKQEDDDRKRLDEVDKIDATIRSMQEEQTLQCYCILACLKGLAEQGCNGPVHDGIDRMEKYLNKKAHNQ